MNEQERADRLARAVDRLIQRLEAAEPPEELNGQDIEGLVRIAKARLELGEAAAHEGLQYEGAVWQKVLERLEGHAKAATRTSGAPELFLRRAGDEAGGLCPNDDELREMEEIAALRQSMSAEMRAFAEIHRDAVWENVRSRLAVHNERKGLFRFFRRDRREAEGLAPALDGLVSGQTVWESADSRTDELIEIARKRRVLGQMAQRASAGAEQRVWSRVGKALHGTRQAPRPVDRRPAMGWQRLGAVAAMLALIVAAVGPIPATGLAGHPFARFIETVGDHVGVTESGPPPTGDGAAVVEGTPATAAEASKLLGVTVSEPAVVPAGFGRTASLYYPTGLTSSGGTFLLSYMSGDTALLVFQEAASGTDLGVEYGSADDVALDDGTPATYFAGGWVPGVSGFTWTAGGARTLVFDRGGVRTIVQYVGNDAGAPDLTAVAGGMR